MTEADDKLKSRGSLSTSRSLLARITEEDPAAWDRLISLYAPLVLHWCKRMDVSGQDIADIVQEVFQSVSRNISTFRKDRAGDTFRGWLRTITRNKVCDHFRRRSQQPQAAGGTEAQFHFSQLPADALSEDDTGDAQDQTAYSELFQRALEEIRSHFEERTWKAFWRVVVDGQSPKDVAEELSMTAGAVRVAKSRVLQRLRRELGDVMD